MGRAWEALCYIAVVLALMALLAVGICRLPGWNLISQ